MKLIEIGESGAIAHQIGMDDFLREVVEATVAHYQRAGVARPWISYVGVEDGVVVGVCGFKSPPNADRVEIAYGASPGNEGKGAATALATELVRIAHAADENLTVFAQTLPTENASTSILKKLGFQLIGTVDQPEDGLVWEWELQSRS